MYSNLQPPTAPEVIMRKPATPFRELPTASEVIFPGVFAWSPVSTSSVTLALGVDRGAWAVWRNRRLTPAPMPTAWFRRASGSPLVYQVSDVLVWLAARRGEKLDTLTTWWQSLITDFETEADNPCQIRRLAAMYARAAGPTVGDVTFTPSGFAAYLDSMEGCA